MIELKDCWMHDSCKNKCDNNFCIKLFKLDLHIFFDKLSYFVKILLFQLKFRIHVHLQKIKIRYLSSGKNNTLFSDLVQDVKNQVQF